MQMRASVTHIESFRLYHTTEWMTFHRLMQELTGTKAETVEMAASSAWHEILERAELGPIEHVRLRGFQFDVSRLDAELALCPLRELRASKIYRIGDVFLDVRGRVDGANGARVDDHKVKFSGSFDAERYADSIQWRLYLDILGVQVFHYNVFMGHASDPDEDGDVNVTLRELHILPLYPYPAMHDDVIEELTQYVAFARVHLTKEGIAEWRARAARGEFANDTESEVPKG